MTMRAAKVPQARVPQQWTPPHGLVFFLLIGALVFNAVLCFINTTVFRVNDTMVMGCELLIISTGLVCGLRASRGIEPYLVLGVFLSYAFLLMALRPGLDPKAVRDFLIPIVFYLLGRCCHDPALADRATLWCGIIVFIFGCFEFMALDVFIKYFNIIQYYVARGSVATSQISEQTGALFQSGIRPDARAILPFLGPHRASSVFLEPISTGNFGAIVYLWSLHGKTMKRRWLTMATGIGAIILSDSRLGSFVCLAGSFVYFAAPRLPRVFWLILPFTILAALAFYGFTTSEIDWANNIGGRILWASQLIVRLPPEAVWGLSAEKPFLSDSGYAYSLNQIGLVGLIGFWSLFIFAPETSPSAWRFKCAITTYICFLLLISDSVYSIKTAALLWFLIGTSDGSLLHDRPLRQLRAQQFVPQAARA